MSARDAAPSKQAEAVDAEPDYDEERDREHFEQDRLETVGAFEGATARNAVVDKRIKVRSARPRALAAARLTRPGPAPRPPLPVPSSCAPAPSPGRRCAS